MVTAKLNPITRRYEATCLYRVKNDNKNNAGSNFIEVRVCGCEVNISNIQVEEVPIATSQSTPYEPYKEHVQTLYLDEPLYKDNELCVHNGQLGYWKNREKIVLDGSDDEGWDIINGISNTNDTLAFSSYGKVNATSMVNNNNNFICDKLNFKDIYLNNVNNDGINVHLKYIRISVLKNKLSTLDLEGFKQWLSENPVTVVYELAEPIFVPILENTPQWILNSFDECTLSIDSNITATSMSAVYTGNVVSVVALDKIQYEQDKVAIENAYKLSVLGIMTGVTI